MKSDDSRDRGGQRGKLSPGGVISGLMLAVTLLTGMTAVANAETRTLKLYFVHTKESGEIAYKRNGRYLKSGLDQINHILRDWRRNEPTNMDPRLLDLLWVVYKEAGGRDYIHVVSAYRSPQTNAMLRASSSGVAQKSQHMLGKAIDFYIPGVKLSRLRAVGLKYQVGGVGYYPRSGSPFVHLDVGGVRHWPRMSRGELLALFPDGKTIHVPSDGKPLPGYQQALASYQARQRSGGTIQVADDSRRSRGRGLLAALFGGGADEQEDNAEIEVASAPRQPARRQAQQQPSAQQQAPARPQVEQPAPESPATVLAALSPQALPVPATAPRPDAEPQAPAEAAQPAVPDYIPFAIGSSQDAPPAASEEAPQEVSDVLMAANVPVPTWRPDYTPPAETIQVAEAAAEDGEAAPGVIAYATPTPRPQHMSSKDVIADLLAKQKDDVPEQMPAPVVSAALAVPSYRPGKAEQEYAVASLAQASLPASKEALAPKVPSVEDTPFVAFLQKDSDSAPSVTLSKGARTTPKFSRPTPSDVSPQPQPHVLPVGAVTAELVLSRESVLNRTQQAIKPTYNARMADAPAAVYTEGFKQDPAMADARRFTGSAVTFLSVAKFRER